MDTTKNYAVEAARLDDEILVKLYARTSNPIDHDLIFVGCTNRGVHATGTAEDVSEALRWLRLSDAEITQVLESDGEYLTFKARD